MEITSKQIQAIQDEYIVVKDMVKRITNNQKTLNMTSIQHARFNYWNGRQTSLEKVINILPNVIIRSDNN